MNESTMRALQQVREGRPQAAGLVQRLDGQLRQTSKGAAIAAGTPDNLWAGQVFPTAKPEG
jgi:hypothetical protein